MNPNVPVFRRRDGTPLIAEEGGARRDGSGYARIVCGPEGEPLSPAFINTDRRNYNGEHAWFEARPGVVLVEVYQDHDEVEIALYRVEGVAGHDLALEKLGQWPGGDPPARLQRYEKAIDAALCKAHQPFCTSIYYAKDEHR